MKSISERMKEALDLRGMKQADLVEKTGIGKSSISTYLSGDYEPKQRNIYKIAKALNVNEAWLMGYDVPMERQSDVDRFKAYADAFNKSHTQMMVSETEGKIVKNYRKADEIEKAIVLRTLHIDESVEVDKPSKKKKYIPTEEDIRSLVARNGRKLTREEAIEFISEMYSDDEEE